jgi:hypothetical protein|tara:strand:+ start:930 stop:1355 length:426 start_codon:yes stop_codon:yes gene_type:complete
MATTTATVSITSEDLMPGMPLAINANSTLMQTGNTTGLELVDIGAGKLTEASAADALHEALGTADTANWVYICNNSTDNSQYIKVGIHDTLIGNLGAGEWLWMPWNMGDADAEINIEAETTGTIPYEYAIFKSTYTLPAKT